MARATSEAPRSVSWGRNAEKSNKERHYKDLNIIIIYITYYYIINVIVTFIAIYTCNIYVFNDSVLSDYRYDVVC